MTLPSTLSTSPFEYPALDYAFLRREGIRLLARGGQWTDFNTHDPGITILEQVCYALTDLAYRINYDIKDLLASGGSDLYEALYSPAQILTINPVTRHDLRKLILDVPGVKNAWIEQVEHPETEPALIYAPSDETLYLKTSTPSPAQREPLALRGIHRVLIETDADSKRPVPGILAEVTQRTQSYRPLGEDFTAPKAMEVQGVVVKAKLEIGAVEDPERLLAKIHFALAEFISPHIHFYALSELLNKGKPMDAIMNGPLLVHGFIDDDELEKLERKISLRTSDLIQEIMNVEGVIAVHQIGIKNTGQSDAQYEDWYLPLDADRAPFFDKRTSLSTIQLLRNGVEIFPNLARVGDLLVAMQTPIHSEPLLEAAYDFRVSPGRDRKISQYHSIQQQFPATYGIGTLGLPESASPQRRAQAKQFKAYLLFFDQVLANAFAQLANAHQLFAFSASDVRSYFSQVVEDVGLGLDEIRNGKTDLQAITEDSEAAHVRRNRFLNHLLARFAEQFTDYHAIQAANLDTLGISGQEDLNKLFLKALIENKAAFLQDYLQIGKGRGTGFDTAQPALRSGLEIRIRYKLGLAENEIYLLEHILLRPRSADVAQFNQTSTDMNWQAGAFLASSFRKDPYSHQISFVFPQRFENAKFKNLIERTVREETPAHLRVHIHWLDEKHMGDFVLAHQTWLNNLSTDGIQFRDARDRLVQFLGIGVPYPLRDLNLLYPPMVAFDQAATIQIENGQADVWYQLCDEYGNPIVENGSRFESRPETRAPNEPILIPTPTVQKDVTFIILAIREGGDPLLRLEVYLNQVISIKSGIDTSLLVAFQPKGNQIVSGNQITTDYDSLVTVRIEKSQEGISYKLVTGPDDNRISLSDPQKGNKDVITLVSNSNFTEDTPLQILAYRTSNWHVSALLNTNLSVKVRPNPSVAVNLQPTIIDYGVEATLSLTGYQDTAGYKLYKRELTPAEYVPDATSGSILVHTDEDRDVFIQSPEKITDWNSTNGFVLVDEFQENNGLLSVSTGSLSEDALFIVRATKVENGESLQLDQTVAVLVRPDTTPVLDGLTLIVPTGTTGTITVNNTQKGVAYQLRLEANNELVNPPGYHFTDRGITTTRLEVDFIVETPGDPVLLLPTGPITESTTFNVLAIKVYTGVSAELSGRVTLDVAS